jgi:hypothetical protein
LPSHFLPTEQHANIMECYKFLLTSINASFYGVPIIATLGNHDTYPVNQMPGTGYSHILIDFTNLFLNYKMIPADNVPAQNKMTTSGFFWFYSPAFPKIRIFIRNCVLEEPTNIFVKDDGDPGGQDAYYSDLVAGAVNSSEKVWVLGHFAPSFGVARPRAPQRENEISGIHPRVVMKHISGHTHLDELQIHRAWGGSPLGMTFVVPSMTPLDHIWPSIRKVDFDPISNIDIDFHQYHVNLTRTNAERKVTLEHFYSARESYGLNDLSLDSVASLVERMKIDELVASKYLLYSSTRGDVSPPPCNVECRKALYCKLGYNTRAAYESCMAN